MNRNWWGAAWLEKMQRLAEAQRFAEGSKYALGNRVQQVRFDGRTIAALVQGPGEPACAVRITFDPFTQEQWDQLFTSVRDPRALASSLAAGELPLEVQTAFSKAKLRFMPERYADLHLECACPDWLKPCRHLVAVWLRFGKDFDRDPFLLFQLRGMKRDDLFDLMRGPAPAAPEPEPDRGADEDEELTAFEVKPVPLPVDPELFWAEPALPSALPETSARSLLDDDIFEMLGSAKFIRSWPAVVAQFHQVYDSVYEFAIRAARKP